MKKGFTLIELLVVISIIGLLSAVVLSSLNNARQRSRDTARIAWVKQIQTALELYYDANGRYPGHAGTGVYYFAMTPYNGGECGYISGGGPGAWCDLETALAPYLAQLPRESQLTPERVYLYKYSSNRREYGLRVILEAANDSSSNDGGYNSMWFEVGQLPTYCMSAYTGSNRDWTYWSSNGCRGGN